MANITNRSPWVVTCPGQQDTKIRLKSKALAYLEELSHPKAKMAQLDTAWEVQIKLRDKEGNVVQQTKTFDSKQLAEKWATDEEARILNYKKQNGKFDTTFETMSLEEGLNLVLEEHYKGMASYKENKYRIPQIVQWFGKKKLLKEVSLKDMRNYRTHLENEGYSASSIRNFFVLMSVLFKHAKSEWLFNVASPVDGIILPKPDNAIERYWEGNESDRLFKSIEKNCQWLMPIVILSLEISFRMGELVPETLLEEHEDQGLMWEGVDFEKETIRIFKEKNDHTKKPTDIKGRTVPMTSRIKEVLMKVYEEHPTKKGRVFYRSTNSVGHAFKRCCENAEPPIENLTFHSIRKIAVYDLSKKVSNPILLSKISGHKSLQVLSDRYFKPDIEDLKALVQEIDTDNPVLKAILTLEKSIGINKTKDFLKFVRKANIEDGADLLEELKTSC